MEIELKFKEGFIRYKKSLEEKLNKAKKERQSLIEKFTNGELLTQEDANRNKRLADAIKGIEKALEKVAEVEFYDNVEKTVIALADPSLTQKQKDAGIAFVTKSFIAFNKTAINNLSSVTDLSRNELQNISHTIITVRKSITELRYEIHILKKYGHETAELEGKKQLEEDKLQMLEQFKGIIFNESSLEESLRSLTNNKTPDGVKDATINKFRKMIKKHKDLKIDNLVMDIKEHPIDNLDDEPIVIKENTVTPNVAIHPDVEDINIESIVGEEQTQEDKDVRSAFEGPRLLDKQTSLQTPIIVAVNSPTLDKEEKLEELHSSGIVQPIEEIKPANEQPKSFNKIYKPFEESYEDDEVFTFVSPRTPFVFPEDTEEKPQNKETIVVENNPIVEEKPIVSEEKQNEAMDAEYEQIDDDFEMEDNSFKGKTKRRFQKFKNWLYGGYDYDDYEIDDDYIYEDEDDYENPNSFKNNTKETLAKVGGWLKKSWKPIASITGAVIMVYALSTTLKSCKKDATLAVNSKDNTSEPTIETTIETTHSNAMINNLIDKGYSEYNAILMNENFDDNTLYQLLSNPYSAAVENYATTKAFNYMYLTDYEETKEIYGITSEKVVDYVNRSHKIMETTFFEDLTINEIVGILKAVDEQEIFKDETNGYNHAINAALTSIYNDYVYGTSSIDSSVKKIEALKYFAPDGTDLDSFLTKFAEINKSVLQSRGNVSVSEDTKRDMYVYLNVFANTFAGNTEGFNKPDQNAVLEDTYDWNTAYVTFIKPLMSMYITENNAEDFACLQINMLSNYEQWIQINGCNEETVALG